MHSYLQGRFRPHNPKKYVGNSNDIVFRSSWELMFMKWADTNPSVINWGSEILQIPYFNPVDNKMHRYFPDFVVNVLDKDEKKQTWIVEVKPETQTIDPRNKNYRSKKKMIRESCEYAKNEAKWLAAMAYCKTKNWKFVILTEKELGISK